MPAARSKRTENIDPQGSKHGGFFGLFETALRRFKVTVHALTLLPFYVLGSVILGLALTPGVWLFSRVSGWVQHSSDWIRFPAYGTAVAAGYFLYGFTLILIIPLINRLFIGPIPPWRGPYYSLPTVRWYLHNGLTYLVRYTFLPFITPSPFGIYFYRAMGMKVGRGVVINTENISDPSLIELGDHVTIGGSVTIIAHYGVAGYLVISPVVIRKGATVGIRATIMAGVSIGEQARILPHSVVLPKTVIPAGETWGGVPARRITESVG